MITLKYWNSLSTDCRKKIVETILGKPQFYDDSIIQEYHHNFDYDSTGKMLKTILSSCYIRDHNIEVRCLIKPFFHVKRVKSKIIQKALKMPRPVCHKYYFRLYTKSDPDDGETVWKEAYTENDARNMVYSDYHSITRLDLLRVE